jgi:phosphate:Na+ symporter
MGANIGTCATALLAVIGKPREAVRCAVVHRSGNDRRADLAAVHRASSGIGDRHVAGLPELSGMRTARSGDAAPDRQRAHLLQYRQWLIFIWFTTQIARLVEWLVPDKPLEEEAIIVRTKFLQEELLTTPSLALDQVRMEVMHMGETVNAMLKAIMPAIIKGDPRRSRKSARWTTRSTSCMRESSTTWARSAGSRCLKSRPGAAAVDGSGQ